MSGKRRKIDRFGERLREMRQRAGPEIVTQSALAEAVSVNNAHVSKLELGTVQPTFAMAVELAERLGCSILDFLPDDRREKHLPK